VLEIQAHEFSLQFCRILPSKHYNTCPEIISVHLLIIKCSENPGMKISCPATRVGLNVAYMYKGVMVPEVIYLGNIHLGLYKFIIIIIIII